MKEQTKDNFRCLAAVIFVVAVSILIFTFHDTVFSKLPDWAIVVFFFALLLAAVCLFNRKQKSPEPDRVSFDDSAITRTMPDGKIETVRWADLYEVGIITTDEGPLNEDVFWILAGSNGGCAVSGGAQGMKELLERLQRLPGFDNAAVIEAMGSTTNKKFQCWKRNTEMKPINKG
jgi:hypothetical protein